MRPSPRPARLGLGRAPLRPRRSRPASAAAALRAAVRLDQRPGPARPRPRVLPRLVEAHDGGTTVVEERGTSVSKPRPPVTRSWPASADAIVGAPAPDRPALQPVRPGLDRPLRRARGRLPRRRRALYAGRAGRPRRRRRRGLDRHRPTDWPSTSRAPSSTTELTSAELDADRHRRHRGPRRHRRDRHDRPRPRPRPGSSRHHPRPRPPRLRRPRRTRSSPTSPTPSPSSTPPAR